VEIVCFALYAYTIILFVRIIASFITQFRAPPPALGPLLKVLYDLTEPVLGRVRRLIPPLGMLDLSPLLVFLLLAVLRGALGCR
jgi:YggT family protein